MAINPVEVVEYLDEARGRVTEQFKDKIVFDRYIQLMIKESLNIQLMFKDLMQLRSLDTATGAQLDILGDIVGQERTPLPGELFDTTGVVVPDDTIYRLLIKSKIIKNNTRATPEDIILGTEFILGIDGVTIQEFSAAYNIYTPRYLTKFEKFLISGIVTEYYTLTLLPKPVGVRVEFVEFDGTNFFAFQGVPNAKGFGSYTGTYGYGVAYGIQYGASDFNTVDGGVFANFIEVV